MDREEECEYERWAHYRSVRAGAPVRNMPFYPIAPGVGLAAATTPLIALTRFTRTWTSIGTLTHSWSQVLPPATFL